VPSAADLQQDRFNKAFVEKVSKFVLGPGSKPGVTHGPLIHKRALQKAQEHTEDAIKHGGKVLLGGHIVEKLGPNFFELTVIQDATAAMKIAHEETFGPVAPIFPFDTEDEVIQRANDTEVGLAGYFYSKDIHRCYRVAEALEVGMIGINTGLVSDPAMPFGGVKESGFGREGSTHGIDEYVITKAVTLGGLE
jgi:succinate-semialdehyde dehydrogenase / glutarate-semialdehyde dehydrogenase